MNTRKVISLMAIGLLCATVVYADVPNCINFQGTLADSAGTPITGTRQLHLAIYSDSTSGSPLWNETHPSVDITDGQFFIFIGTVNPLVDSLFTGDRLWLGIRIEPDLVELSPRTPLVTVPYGFKSAETDHAAEADLAQHAVYADTATWAIGIGDIAYADTANFAFEAGVALTANESYHAAYSDTATWALGFETITHVDTADYAVIAGFATQAEHADSALHADYAVVSETASQSTYADTAYFAHDAGNSATSDEATHSVYSDTASWALGFEEITHVDTADYALQAETSTNAATSDTANWAWNTPEITRVDTADYALQSGFADYATTTDTADYAFDAGTAATATVANHATYSDTASWALGFEEITHVDTADYALTADSAYQAAYSDTAQHAVSADPDNDWTISGVDMFSGVSGNVGVGTVSPTNKLHVVGSDIVPILNVEQNGSFRAMRVYSANACAIWVENAGNHGLRMTNANGHGIYVQNAGNNGIHVSAAGGWAGYFNGDGYFSGDVGIGVPTPSVKLDVDGTVKMTGFQLTTGVDGSRRAGQDNPAAGDVLTSDEFGNGTWQTPAGGDITAVNTGTGLTGGGTSGDVTLGVDVPLVLSGAIGGANSVISGTTSSDGIAVYGESSYSGTCGYLGSADYGAYGVNGFNSGYLGGDTVGVFGQAGTSINDYAGIFRGKTFVDGELTIDGSTTTSSFTLSTGTDVGHVLTCQNTSGDASWQPVPNDSDWTISGDNLYTNVSGYVGIGTTEPLQELDVVGDVSLGGGFSDYDGSAEEVVLWAQSDYWHIGVQNETTEAASDFYIGTAPEDGKFHIENGGNVGIGTNIPSEKLDLYGDIAMGGGGSDYDGAQEMITIWAQSGNWSMGVQNESAASQTDFFIGTYPEDGKFHIQNDGNVGIGTNMPMAKLDVNGNVSLGDGGTIFQEIRTYYYITEPSGSVTYVPLPSGYTTSNTRILTLEINTSADEWLGYGYPESTSQFGYLLRVSGGVHQIAIRYPDTVWFHDRTIRAVLMKI